MQLIRTLFFLVSLFLFARPVNADGITSIAKTNKLLGSAEAALKKKSFKEAIEAYNSALKENPDLPPQVQLNLAGAYYQTREYSKAQKHYLSVASVVNSPGLKSVAYQQIGNIYFNQKNYTSAIDWYKKSLMINPENQNARFNYELAYKLKKKAEAENEKNQQNQPDKKGGSKKSEKEKKKDSSKKESGESEKNQPQKPGEEKKDQGQKDGKKGQDKKENQPQKGDKKPGEDKPGDKETDVDKKQENGKEETPDKQSEEESKNKNQESNLEDPESQRMDKKKLKEAGLTEEQAKNLLQAMRQNEVKYLQQRRFKSSKGGSEKNGEKY